MKMSKTLTARVAVATVGGVLLAGVAGAAFADDSQQSDDVDVNVTIQELTGPGALAMTAGIFLPAFGFSLLFHDRLEKVVENKTLHGFLEGVAAGVVGLIAATTVELAAAVVQRLPSLPLGLLVFVLALAVLYLWRSRLNVVLAILGAGLLSWLLFGFAP